MTDAEFRESVKDLPDEIREWLLSHKVDNHRACSRAVTWLNSQDSWFRSRMTQRIRVQIALVRHIVVTIPVDVVSEREAIRVAVAGKVRTNADELLRCERWVPV